MMDLSVGIPMIIMICIHCVGIYLHVKIIKTSRNDKQITWKLAITNSCMLMAHHTHCIFMEGITYIVQDLYIYTGEWFCYTSKATMYYGNTYTTKKNAKHPEFFQIRSKDHSFFKDGMI